MGTGEAQDDAQSLPPQPPAAAAPPPVYTQLHVDGIGFPGLQLKHAADRGYYIATGGWVNAGSTLLQVSADRVRMLRRRCKCCMRAHLRRHCPGAAAFLRKRVHEARA